MITQEDYKAHYNSQPTQTTDDRLVGPILDVRSLFISDLHLGSDMCDAPAAVGFLNHIKAEYIVVLGDMIDGWTLDFRRMEHLIPMLRRKRLQRIRQPQAQADVAQILLRHARAGSFVFLQGGNHDPMLMPFVKELKERPRREMQRYFAFRAAGYEATASQRAIQREFEDTLAVGHIFAVHHLTHRTADNRYLLTMHGHEFDGLIKNREWLGIFGTKLRDQIFAVSEWLSRRDEHWPVRSIARQIFGLDEHFSLADYLHHQTEADCKLPNAAIDYVKAKNEVTLRRRQEPEWANEPLYDGVILGHSHVPALHTRDGLVFGNCGDWINPAHNTAMVEHHDGRLELMQWNPERGIVPFSPKEPVARPTSQAKGPPAQLAPAA